MKSYFLAFLGISLMGTLSCQRPAEVVREHWKIESEESGGASSDSLKSSDSSDIKVTHFKNLSVIFTNQQAAQAQVMGSFQKEVRFENKLNIYDKVWVKNLSSMFKTDSIVMNQFRFLFLKVLKSQYPELNSLAPEHSQLVIRKSSVTKPDFELAWQFTYLNSFGKLEHYWINKYYSISHEVAPVSCFYESQAALYPMGPLKSQLSTITIDKLISNSMLASEAVRLAPLNSEIPTPDNNIYNFPSDDPRFFQLHAFHFVHQSYRWFEENLKFKMPHQISIETAVGYPEKTNTAFYYGRIIRLGDGDDVVFSKIPMDPSITTHESIHAIVDEVAQLPFTGEGGSINEAFADFFTTNLLNNPHLGEVAYKKAPFKRTVANSKKWTEKTGGLYADSGIISGLLWQLRIDLGAPIAQEIAWKLLLMSHPETKFEDFRSNLNLVLTSYSADIQIKAQAALRDRGWII